MSRSLFDKVIRLCESRGFAIESCFEGSLGTAYTYQFGPLGTELRRNLRSAWWHDVVRSKANVYGFEGNGGITHASNKLSTSSPALSDIGNEKDQGNIISEPDSDNKFSVSEECSWNSEDTSNLTQLVGFIPGIKVPFGTARNRRYLCKPENHKYILRYVIFGGPFGIVDAVDWLILVCE